MASNFDDVLLNAFKPSGQAPGSSGNPFDNALLSAFDVQQPQEKERPSLLGEIGRGVKRGVGQEGSLALALGGTIAQAFGAPKTADDLLKRSIELDNAVNTATPPTISKFEDIGSLGDFLHYSAGALGEQLPNIATTVLGGGIGGLAARTAARTLTKDATKELLKKYAERGIAGGAFGASTGIETGSTAQEQYQATGEINPLINLGAGSVKGALELVTPFTIAGRFGLGPRATKELGEIIFGSLARRGLPVRIAGGVLGTAGEEGLTEAVQEAVDIAARRFVDNNYDVLGPDARSRVLNSAATGAIVGGFFGGATGAIAKPHVQIPGSSGDVAFTPPNTQEPGGTASEPHADGTTLQPVDQPGVYLQPSLDADQSLFAKPPPPGYPQFQQPMDFAIDPTTATTIEEIGNNPGVNQPTPQFSNFPGINEQVVGVRTRTDRDTGVQTVHQGQQVSDIERNPFATTEKQTAPYVFGKSLSAKDVSLDYSRDKYVDLSQVAPENLSDVEQRVNKLSTSPRDPSMSAADYIKQREKQINELVRDGVRFGTEDERALALSKPAIGGKLLVPKSQVPTQLVGGPGLRFRRPFYGEYDPSAKYNYVFRNMERVSAANDDANVKIYDRGKAVDLTEDNVEAKRGKRGVTLYYDKGKLTREQIKGLERVRKFYSDLLGKFNLDEHIFLGANSDPGQGGHFMFGGKGLHNINIHQSYLNQAHTLAVAAHEFGHFLFFTKFAQLPAGMQQRIMEDYQRFLAESENKKVSQFGKMYASPANAASFRPGGYYEQLYAGSPRRIPFANLDKQNYFYSFDEWSAEQVARWIFTTQKPLSSIDRFFKSIANMLKSAWMEVYGVNTLAELKASPAVEEWLDSVYERRFEGKQPMSLVATQVPGNLGPREAANMTAYYLLRSEPLRTIQPELAESDREAQLMRKKALLDLDKFSKFIRWSWNIQQITEKNQHIPGLRLYRELLDFWQNTKMRWLSRSDGRVRRWTNLGKDMGDRLAKFIFDIQDGTYLKKGEEARWPTAEEMKQLIDKHKLNEEAVQLYQDIKSDFQAALDAFEKSLVKDANRSIEDPVVREQKLSEVKRDIDSLRNRPYFPAARFGDWTIVVRDPKGNIVRVEAFETRSAQLRRWPQIQKEFPENFLLRLDKFAQETKTFRGLPPSLLKHIGDKLQLTGSQRDALDVLMFELAPSQSFRHHFERREGIAGYSLDAMRAYANYFFHGANHLARIEWEEDLRGAIGEVEKETKQLGNIPGADITKRRDLIDYMNRHLDYILNPKNEWASMRGMAFTYWLGFSPVSAALNLTQVPMVAYPYLAARYNDAGAVRQLMASVRDIQKIYRGDKLKLGETEVNAINLGVELGTLDESQAMELAAVSEGSNLQRIIPGTKANRMVKQFTWYAAWLFQNSEKFNRRVVFRAAYRLAKEHPDTPYLQELADAKPTLLKELITQRGWSREDALAFFAAQDAVQRTMFEYSRHARPEFMRGKAGTLLTFYMFKQSMLWFARYSPGRGRYLLMLLFAAGLTGMPGYEDFEDLAKLIAKQLGYGDWDPEKELRSFAKEVGFDKPDLFLHGISRYGFGLPAAAQMAGIPVPNVDLSASMGMGRVIPGMQALEQNDYNKFMTGLDEQVAGAAFGIPITMIKTLMDDQPDQWKRWERMFPRQLKAASRAMRYYSEGREKSATGATVQTFDVNDPQQLAEVVAQGLGFTPTRLSQKWDMMRFQQEQQMYWQIRKGMILKQYDYARQVGDREGLADMRKAINNYNSDAPVGMKISGDTLQQSLRTRARDRAIVERGLTPQKSGRAIARETQQLFPEVEPLPRARSTQ